MLSGERVDVVGEVLLGAAEAVHEEQRRRVRRAVRLAHRRRQRHAVVARDEDGRRVVEPHNPVILPPGAEVGGSWVSP